MKRRQGGPSWGASLPGKAIPPLLLLIYSSTCHAALRLTFPPARSVNDNLDNAKYGAPCATYPGHTAGGNPPPPRTELLAGSFLNVTWSLTRLSMGGFRVELLRPYDGSLGRARYAEETELLVIMDQRRPGSRPLNSTQGARVPKGTSLEGTPLVGAFGVTPLTNESVSNWGVSADPTTQWALVNLPPHLCKGCTLRLTHQALDQSSDPSYRLVSCADVDVVLSGVNQCQGCSGGIAPCSFLALQDTWQCACDPSAPLSGEYCERHEECVVDSDCGANGMCIDLLSSNAPSRQCYCGDGWMGPQCSQQSPVALDPEVDLSLWEQQYPFNVSAPNITVWWKIINSTDSTAGAQIEVAVAAVATSYVAVGWRPAGLPWVYPPDTEPPPYKPLVLTSPPPPHRRPPPKAKPKAHPPPPKSKAKAKLPPKPTKGPAAGAPPVGTAQAPAAAPALAEQSQGQGDVTEGALQTSDPRRGAPKAPAGSLTPGSESSLRPPALRTPALQRPGQERGLLESRLGVAGQGAARGTPPLPKPKPAPAPEEAGPALGIPDLLLTPTATPGTLLPIPKKKLSQPPPPVHQKPPLGPPPPPPPLAPQVVVQEIQRGFQGDGAKEGSTEQEMPGMFVQDMTIVYARGAYYRIQDAWTLPTHGTPQPDTALGGTSDISAASGHEETARGMMFARFRRPLSSSDTKTDYPIQDQDYLMVWALGQTAGPPLYSATPAPPASAGTLAAYQQALSAGFYRKGELKYHGNDKSQRGSFGRLNFFLGGPTLSAATCAPSWIADYSCMLNLTSSANVSLHWALRGTGAAFALSSAASGWLALGFSLSGGAEGSDVVIGLSPGEPPPGTDPATLHPNVGTYFIKGNSAQGLERTEGRLNITQPLMQTAQGVTLLRFERSYEQAGGAPSIRKGSQATCHLVWAVSDSPSLNTTHLVTNRGALLLNLASGRASQALNVAPWLTAHALLMGLGITLLLLPALLAARLAASRPEPPGRQRFYHSLHIGLSLLATVTLLAGVGVALRAALGSTEGSAPLHAVTTWGKSLHGLTALGAVMLVLVELVSGVCCRPRKKDQGRLCWDVAHRGAGVAAMALALGSSALGAIQYLHLFGSSTTLLVWGLVLGALTGVQLLVYATLVLCLGWGAQQEGPPAAKMAVDPLEASLARGKGRRRAGSQRQAKSGRLQQWPPPNVAWPEHNLSFPGSPVLKGSWRQTPSPSQMDKSSTPYSRLSPPEQRPSSPTVSSSTFGEEATQSSDRSPSNSQ